MTVADAEGSVGVLAKGMFPTPSFPNTSHSNPRRPTTTTTTTMYCYSRVPSALVHPVVWCVCVCVCDKGTNHYDDRGSGHPRYLGLGGKQQGI